MPAVTTIDYPTPLPVEQTGATTWTLSVDGIDQKVTNLTKPYWGPEGYTKGDLLGYYLNASRWILPFLRDRALTLKRMPEGADGDFFYAKNAPGHVPGWVPRAPISSDDADGQPGKVIEYLMAQQTASLVYVANLGCIEMHPWHSRIDALGYPDYAFFDLDPFEVDYRTVKDVALIIKAALDQLGLVGYPRTSGATGLHVYVPIDRVHTFAAVRELITRVCRLVHRADPERTTMAWQISDRTNKVFLDAGMNTEGRNIASAYSVRPHRGATVSTPLRWEELAGDVEPQDFTMASIWPRLAEVGDIFTAVLDGGQTLTAAMEAVGMDPEEERRGPSHSLVVPATAPDRDAPAGEPDAPAEEPDAPAEGREAPAEDLAARPAEPDGPPPVVGIAEEPGELATYQQMRDFAATDEPAGVDASPPATGQQRFVIQHHLATRLHHDLRLERGGTLRSWALPKGLPLKPGLAHLAMQTEDHPLEYLTYEGTIPDGQYGAGPMRIWDTGTYTVIEWEEGKATVTLDGVRHHGEWHLFRPGRRDEQARDPRQWLITRASTDRIVLPPAPPSPAPMLATAGPAAFDDEDWLFEVKWDGVRAIATVIRPGMGSRESNDGSTRLVSRNGNDITEAYPELWPLWERVLAFSAVLDGEVVALGPDGRPDFGLLQGRMHVRGRDRVDRARRQAPVTFVVFDVLALDGQPVTDLPLEDRLGLLDQVLVPGARVLRSDAMRGNGTALFAGAQAQGLEGIMAKRATSTYAPGRRSPDWLKIKVRRTAEVVVGGWAAQSTGSGELGTLAVGVPGPDGLRYLGRVGTGFDRTERLALQVALAGADGSPFSGDVPDAAQMTWSDATTVIEVSYGEVTAGGHLRAPVYVRRRPDVDPSAVSGPS